MIAILAAITIVAYNGIQNRAKASAVQSTVSQLAKKVEAAKITASDDLYPASLATVGITLPSNATYSVNTTGKAYCVIANDGTISYFVTQAIRQPTSGTCTSVNGLVAWWPMNNSPQDISGNDLNAVPLGVTTGTGQNGQPDSAYTFNGTAQLTCSSSTLLRPSSAVTVSAWVNLSSNPGSTNGIFNNGGGGYWLTTNSTLQPSLYITNSTLTTSSNITLNQWYHIVGTFNAGQRVVYINGVEVGADTGPASITTYGETCRIGNVKNIADRFLNGRIDDLRVYERALSAGEVQTMYNAGAY